MSMMPSDEEATYTRWLAGDEALPTLPREQYLRFQARSDRAIKDRRSAPAGGGVEGVRRNPEDPEWSYCPACKTGFLDTGYECNSCGFDAQPLVHLQSACEERGERMHPSGLYESEIANPFRHHRQSDQSRGESEPYSTMIWVSRIEGLQSHLRIIANECASSDCSHLQRLERQALAGIAEADRYLADQCWPAEDEVQA